MDPIRQYELPKIDRKLLAKNVPLKVLDRHIDFVVADEQDRSVIERFLNEDFVDNEPMNRALALTVDEFSRGMQFFYDEILPQKLSILAVDDGRLCGLFLNNMLKVHRSGVRKEPVLKEDYGEEFDTNPTRSEKFKKILVMCDVVNEFVAQNLPDNVDEYFYLNVLSVHKSYTGNGLARLLTIESCKLAYDQGHEWTKVIGSSVATNRIAQNLGFHQFFSVELEKFKAHGKLVFVEKFHDGGKQIGGYLSELKPLIEKYGQ